MENVMKPVSNSADPVLTLTIGLIIEGLLIIALGVVDFFMNHSLYSLTPGLSTLVVAAVGIVPILISPLV